MLAKAHFFANLLVLCGFCGFERWVTAGPLRLWATQIGTYPVIAVGQTMAGS
jgi:hypothetical protein